MSYFNCSKCNKIRRAVNNQISLEGTVESRVDTMLNNVFLLLTRLCEFYAYENSKAIYDTFNLSYLFFIKLIKQTLITFILIIMMNYIKKLPSAYRSNNVCKFKNGIEWLRRPFIMEFSLVVFGSIL